MRLPRCNTIGVRWLHVRCSPVCCKLRSYVLSNNFFPALAIMPCGEIATQVAEKTWKMVTLLSVATSETNRKVVALPRVRTPPGYQSEIPITSAQRARFNTRLDVRLLGRFSQGLLRGIMKVLPFYSLACKMQIISITDELCGSISLYVPSPHGFGSTGKDTIT